MSTSNKAFIASLVFSIASIILVFMFGGEPPAGSAPMAEGFKTPILALEFARSLEDLAFLQGRDAAALRANLMRVQSLDQYFPIAYAGMAALFFFALVLRGNKLAWIAVALAVATILADWVENQSVDSIIALSGLYSCEPIVDSEAEFCIFIEENLMPSVHAPPSQYPGEADRQNRLQEALPVLTLTTWIKWGLIAGYGAMMALLMIRDKRRILALPSAAASLAILATYLSGSSGQMAEIILMTMPAFMLSFPIAAVMYLRSAN